MLWNSIRKEKAARISDPGQEIAVDDNLSITQMLSREVDEKGDITENIMSTNLIVLYENNEITKASELINFETNQYGELSSFSIYATMTVSVLNDIGSSFNRVRFNYFDTTLYYGTAMKATKLEQSSTYAKESWFVNKDITKQTINPQANIKYRYTPSNLEFISYGALYLGRTCESHIFVGSNDLGLGYSYTFDTQNNGKGTWDVLVK